MHGEMEAHVSNGGTDPRKDGTAEVDEKKEEEKAYTVVARNQFPSVLRMVSSREVDAPSLWI